MALSIFFSDDEVISQLRAYFELNEMWSIDFNACLSQVEDYDENSFFLKINDKNFVIDKITGSVSEVDVL